MRPSKLEAEFRAFWKMLMRLGVNAHPDESFKNYVDEKDEPTFDEKTAKFLDGRMSAFFASLGDEVYKIALDEMKVFLK